MKHPAPAHDDGYTLLEMLMVCAILALAAAAAAGLSRPKSDGTRVEAVARELAARMRFARSSAIARNQDVRFVFDLARKEYGIEGETPAKFPANLQIFLEIAGNERQSPEAGAIRFLPGGEATGGTIALRIGQFRSAVAVDWLTGAALVQP